MEKRRESIQNRAIAFILSLAMIIGIIGMVPPITAEASSVIKVPATLTVLEKLTADTVLTEGQYIYIDVSGNDMTGKLPTSISARVIYNTASNSSSDYFGNKKYVRYDTTDIRAQGFDSCPRGAVVSDDGVNWRYYCCYGGVRNLLVYPYVSKTIQGYMYLDVNSNTITLDPDHQTYTVSANDITSVTYQVGEDGTPTQLPSFKIDPNNNTVGDGDDEISILYGLNFSEHVDVELPMNYVVKFDANGGTANESMASQTLDNENNRIASRPATDPTREGYTFVHWSLEKTGATAYDFSQTVTGARTIYAVWQLNQISTPSDSYTLTYGDTVNIGASTVGDHDITYSVTSGDNIISVDATTGVITPKRAGEAQVTITAHDTINAFGTTKTVNVTVNKRNLTVEVNSKSKTYGDPDPTFDYKVSENSPNQLVAGDSINDGVSFTGTLQRADVTNQNVGTYTIGKGSVDSNKYNIKFETGTLTINPKPINIKLDDNTKVYGAEDPELTFTLDENTLAYNETVEDVITGTPEREEGKDVGTYVISKGDIASPNYAITFTEGTFEITKRPITIIAEDKERFYGFQDPELTYTNSALTPLYEDDELEDLGITLEREEGEKFGEYTIKATDIKTNNYDVEFVEGTFTINKVEGGAEFDLEKTDGVKGVGINKTDQEMLDLTLTADEWQMVEDGAGVRVYFEVTDAEATSAEESNIKSAAGMGYKIGESYDINLYKKFDHLDRTQLFTTNKKVKFTFKLSSNLTNVPDGYKREYQVVRIHDGKAEVIDSEFNAATQEVSFDSDKFSIFAVTYKDTSTLPTEIKDTVKTEIKVVEKEVKRAVKTGDAIPITSIMFLMSISAMGIGIIFKKKYTEIRNDK